MVASLDLPFRLLGGLGRGSLLELRSLRKRRVLDDPRGLSVFFVDDEARSMCRGVKGRDEADSSRVVAGRRVSTSGLTARTVEKVVLRLL